MKAHYWSAGWLHSLLFSTLALLMLTHLSAQVGIRLYLKSATSERSRMNDGAIRSYIEGRQGEFGIVTLDVMPGQVEKEELKEAGLRLFGYVPEKSFYCHISPGADADKLSRMKIFSISDIDRKSKFHPLLLPSPPDWAMKGQAASLIISYFPLAGEDEVSSVVSRLGGRVTSFESSGERAFIFLDSDKIQDLADVKFIYFIEATDPPSHPENYGARQQHRSNMLAQDFAGGSKYDGSGVSVGMHDDGIIGPHIDYQGRLPIQFPTGNSGNHGDHVAGTIMGAGNLDPRGRGMAFGSDLYVYSADNDNYDSAVSHYLNYNVVITSKSYSNGCNAGYTSLTRQLDQQSRQNPSLIHIFSAGNDGTSDCGYGAGSGWGNITGGHKMGKNVIATGNLSSSDALAGSSSRGPADDGRIKPDICAKGSSVYSTIDENTYDVKSGTSMACPGISGSVAQLYHAYRSLNSGNNPPSGFIKACILNTADDLGNPGPDFRFGWGRINLRRAMAVISGNQVIASSIGSTGNNVHNLTIPSGISRVNIMVYWHDYEATASAARAIVNNLDMKVTDPSLNNILPWVLNPAPNATALNSNAVRAVDSLNNMEQVTINAPAAGSYSITISATSVPQGPQPYFIVYEYLTDDVYLTYPNGGEGLVPGETEVIRWDAWGNTSTFDVQYSTNGGTTWNSIATSVSAALRQLNWTVPSTVTGQALVRVSRGLKSDQSDAAFSIIGVPTGLYVEWVCPDSVKLNWNSVSNATDYRVYQLGNKYMDSVSTTSATSYVFHGLSHSRQYWFSVSANAGTGSTGRRAIAVQSPKGIQNCPLEFDASLSSTVSPVNGNYLSCVVNTIQPSVYIANRGINTIGNVPVKCYQNGVLVQQTIYGDSIQAGDSALVTFNSPLSILTPDNRMLFKTELTGDPNPYNDSSLVNFIYRSSQSVSAPWEENFEDFFSCGTMNNCGETRCVLFNGWINDSTYFIDDNDWRTDNDGTPSGQTGPSVDHDPGTQFGYYLFTEASADCFYMTSSMMTPCLDLTDMSMPRFTFWYHMYGEEMGELHVDLLTSEGFRKDIIFRHSGNLGDQWLKDSIDLEDYAGQFVSVRFRGITGPQYRSDMALDDIELFESDPFFGIEDAGDISWPVLYPNPSHGLYTLGNQSKSASGIELSLTDARGVSLPSGHIKYIKSGICSIDISACPGGVYLLNMSLQGVNKTVKLIKL